MGGITPNIWYDPEGDFLEIIFETREGYFRPSADDRVIEKVDDQGHLLGFHILGLRNVSGSPINIDLPSGSDEESPDPDFVDLSTRVRETD